MVHVRIMVDDKKLSKNNIHEYCEEMEVIICKLSPEDGENYKNVISNKSYIAHKEERWVVQAFNEGGFNSTKIDLLELFIYIKNEVPELWKILMADNAWKLPTMDELDEARRL